MKRLLVVLFACLLFSCGGSPEPHFDEFTWSGGWQPTNADYQEWLVYLGSEVAVKDFVIEIRICIRGCIETGAIDYLALHPSVVGPPCTCIYNN